MELVVQSYSVPYLRRIFSELVRQEETAETIVPDSEPDIGTILDVSAEPILRGKDCRSGSVIVSGGIKGSILYLPEGENAPRSLDVYLPFSIKVSDSAMTETSQVVVSFQIHRAEGRIINSRKAMLRVELGCQIQAFLPTEAQFNYLAKVPKCLQLKKAEYRPMLPLETTEKSFQLTEDLSLSVPCAQLYQCSVTVDLGDTRLMGNKGLFKGNVLCKVLYLGDDQKLHVHRQALPFSQYCEFLCDFDEDAVDYYPCVTGYDLNWDKEQTPGQISVSIHLLMQAIVVGRRSIQTIEDAYVTCGQLETTWQDTAMDVELDRQRLTQTIQKELQGPVTDVVDWDICAQLPEWTRQDGQRTMATTYDIHVLGYDRQGMVCSMGAKVTQTQVIAATEAESCICQNPVAGPMSLAPVPNGLEAKTEMVIQTQWFAKQTLHSLHSGSMEDTPQENSRPSIVLKRICRESTIWDIAKASCAQPEAICRANDWTAETVPEGAVLLIPVG